MAIVGRRGACRLDPGQATSGFFSASRTHTWRPRTNHDQDWSDPRATVRPQAMSAARTLEALNPEQRCAVEHGVAGRGANIAGPLLVIAGAGSGKTNTLAHRVAHLIVHGADPRRILLLTFSRRAAAEMERRLGRIVAAALGEPAAGARNPILWSGTFHAVGARLLRMYAHAIGLDPAFTIHDREDSADLMNLVRHELGLSDKAQRFPLKATCLAIYSRAVNAAEPLDQVLGKQFPWCAEWKDELRRLFAAYVEAKQKQHVLDYDDLLLYWGELMGIPELAGEVGGLFDHVLVDEYQDTNALQASILLRLKPTGAGLTVVGDDAQAIYGFRAATVRNILDFPVHFQPPAAIVTLEQNYRSTQPILAASNAVIGLARERFTKSLRSHRGAGEKPVLVSVLDDIGPAAAGKALDRISGRALTDALATFSPPAKAAGAWRDLVTLMQRLNGETAGWPAEFDLVRQWYQPHLEQRYPDAAVRAGDLEQLQRIAGGYGSRAHFLTDLTLDPPSATSDEAGPPRLDEDYLILSTIHSAKGQEWRCVFVLNVVDGCIPSDMATGSAEEIEEERRLPYVAMTRAKDQLLLLLPQRFYVHSQARRGDKHLYASRTRFIPAGIAGHFDPRSSLGSGRGSQPGAQRTSATVDIGALMRQMWSGTGT